jgi:hypothetical protein
MAVAPSSAVHASTNAALRLVIRCVDAEKTAGRPPTFSLTPKVLTAFLDLPLIDAANETALGNFIDHLFFVLYEGAGDENLRFLDKSGGLLSKDQCGVIWTIKTLRNKWFRHDPEHGGAGAIRKSYEQLKGDFAALGLDRHPREPHEFRSIQRRILQDVIAFLTILLEKIEKFSGGKS